MNEILTILFLIITITVPSIILVYLFDSFKRKVYKFIPSIMLLVIATFFYIIYGPNMFKAIIVLFPRTFFIITLISSVISFVLAFILIRKEKKI